MLAKEGFYSRLPELDEVEFAYYERVAIAYEQRRTMLELIATAAQIASTVQDPKASTPLIQRLFDIFEPGKMEQLEKKSSEEDAELMAFARNTFAVKVGKGVTTLMPGRS